MISLECDLSKCGEYQYRIDDRDFLIEVVDSVQDYLDLMKEIFDFDALREFFKSGVRVTCDALNGGTQINRIFYFSLLLIITKLMNLICFE